MAILCVLQMNEGMHSRKWGNKLPVIHSEENIKLTAFGFPRSCSAACKFVLPGIWFLLLSRSGLLDADSGNVPIFYFRVELGLGVFMCCLRM